MAELQWITIIGPQILNCSGVEHWAFLIPFQPNNISTFVIQLNLNTLWIYFTAKQPKPLCKQGTIRQATQQASVNSCDIKCSH